MKKIFKIGASGILLVLIVALVSLRTFGYEPQDQRPGLWVKGELVAGPVTDWSFSNQFEEIFVQTNTRYGIPHSITTYCTTYNGDFYLFSAYYQGGSFPEGRSWNVNVMRDPRVRLKIGEQLYDQTVSYILDDVTKEPVLQSFIEKYPQWDSPGIDNVHIFLVGPSR